MSEGTKDNLSLTDDEDDLEDDNDLPEITGTLNKWTNYIHGWQDRYIVLKDGTLSYYKSENDTAFGCRGAVSLAKAVLQAHEFDECRFDVAVNDCVWYLRAENAEERQRWLDALEVHKAESGYGSESSLRRHGSMLSLTSGASLSTASASSFKKGRGLREKLAEMETFRDILCRQVDTLQSYFDACATVLAQQSVHDLENDDLDDMDDLESPLKENGSQGNHKTFTMWNGPKEKEIVNILQQHGAHAIDFKGESYTFKATTAGILATLSHCIELMSQREEAWRKRLEKEVDKRKKTQDNYKQVLAERPKPVILGGPDYEEGPHSMINEEEFFDAVDATLDKFEEMQEKKLQALGGTPTTEVKKKSTIPETLLDPSNQFYDEINSVVQKHIERADMTCSDIANQWQLIHEELDMKVYRLELEEDGLVVDPLKAVFSMKGITGHELCRHFFDPAVRMEWEGTIDSSNTIEWLSKDTVISYQIFKRIWPAAQRDSLFWSAIRHYPSEDDNEAPDYWIVCNHTCDHSSSPNPDKYVRVKYNVGMIAQTVVSPPDGQKEISREHLTCRIQYSAQVNPGGWAPASIIRQISKRELPKFLKHFTTYVYQKVQNKPILF